jgi:DUF1009 family protein
MTHTLAIWAGEGSLPYQTAVNALAEGRRVLVVAFPGCSDLKLLASSGAIVRSVGLARMGANFRLLKKEGVNELVMIGKFHKKVLFGGGFDPEGLRLLLKLANLRDMTLFNLLASELKRRGIRVLSQARYIPELLAPAGVLTRRKPGPKELADIRYGFGVARQLADLDVGQTVVVRRGSVIAIEALEGTDATIQRVIPSVGRSCVVVKAGRKRQDERFDIPGVGLQTLERMNRSGIRTLAVEAGKCLLADRDELIRRADRSGMCIIGIRK